MATSRKYPVELRERAVRLTVDARSDPKTRQGACRRIGELPCANFPNATAQPAVRQIGVQPRVPEQRNRELRHAQRKGKIMHSRAQLSGVSFGNTGDQIGGPGQRQRGRESANDRDDLAFQPEPKQGFINRSLVETALRDADVPGRGIAGGRDLALAQRVLHAHDADETVAEQ